MSNRFLPWLIFAAALLGLYYYYGRTPEVTYTVPRQLPAPSNAIPTPLPPEGPSPSGEVREDAPAEATARDAAAAMRQLDRDQQKEIGKPSLYPDAMDDDLRKIGRAHV